VVEEVRKYFREKVYETIIPRNVRLSEAPSHGHCLLLIMIHVQKVLKCTKTLAKEVLSRESKSKGLGRGIDALFQDLQART
jgi:chromosome partitioning protein